MFSKEYLYTIFQVEFPSLDKRLEDSFYFENTESIGEIRLIKSWGVLYSIYNGIKSRLDSPEWIEDILIAKIDLSLYFEDYNEDELIECVIKRVPNDN